MVPCRWNACPAPWTVTSSADCSGSATSPGSVHPAFRRPHACLDVWQMFSNGPVVSRQPQEGYLMVRQFQYLGWAGHRDVPASKRSFLKLVLQVDQWQREGEEGEGRTIVHCL